MRELKNNLRLSPNALNDLKGVLLRSHGQEFIDMLSDEEIESIGTFVLQIFRIGGMMRARLKKQEALNACQTYEE